MTKAVSCVLAAFLAVVSVGARTLVAQEPAPETLPVFLDCGWVCDFDHVRREIRWADWVRDRKDADVHVLVTSETTGGGGQRYEATFIGRRAFDGWADTLHTTVPPAATDDETRNALVAIFRLGLVRFAARTAVGERLHIGLPREAEAGGEQERISGEADDPWNQWVFSLSWRAFLHGESRQRFSTMFGSFSANRTTEAWKVRLSVNANRNESEFELPTETVKTVQEDYGLSALFVRSVASRFAAGIRLSGSSATFNNVGIGAKIAPAVEYNVFDYEESSRRSLTFLYAIGPAWVDFQEETVFGRMHDRLVEQSLTAAVGLRQPWGSVNTSLQVAHLIGWSLGADVPAELADQDAKYRAVLSGSVELGLVKGLSLDVGGYYTRIRDQIALRRGEASDEEVLLRLRQLETSYRYFISVGFRYSFGSIYNNVVNTRFDGSNPGGFVFIN